jgi:hypothetical protein
MWQILQPQFSTGRFKALLPDYLTPKQLCALIYKPINDAKLLDVNFLF